MFSFKKALSSGIARKLLNGVTAIALVAYIFVHLLGNLTLYAPDAATRFNEYSATLHGLGWGLWIIEALLFATFGLHAFIGIKLWLDNRKARKQGYQADQRSKGGPSKFNWSSLTMPMTGAVLLVFTVVHVAQFRYGLFTDVADYEPGEPGANFDLYAMVVDAFQHPGWVAFYCFAIFLMGWHLRHGFWSILQTLGAMNDRWSKPVYALGALLAIVLAAGFFFIPLYLYFFVN